MKIMAGPGTGRHSNRSDGGKARSKLPPVWRKQNSTAVPRSDGSKCDWKLRPDRGV